MNFFLGLLLWVRFALHKSEMELSGQTHEQVSFRNRVSSPAGGASPQRLSTEVTYRRGTVVPIDSADTMADSGPINVHDESAVAACAAGKLADISPEVRTSALEALMRDAATVTQHAPTIERLLDDDVWFVRRAAVAALSRLSSPVVQPRYFLPRLVDPSEDVRAAALESLGRLDASQLSDDECCAIRRHLIDAAWLVRKAAVNAVLRLQPHHLTTRSLGQLLLDDVAHVRLAAIEALNVLSGLVGLNGEQEQVAAAEAEGGVRVESCLEQHAATLEQLAMHDEVLEVRRAADQLWRASGHAKSDAARV
jgi:HEAT repeat protein